MLVVYTPDQQSDELVDFHTRALESRSYDRGLPKICRAGKGVAMQTSWCREVVTDNLRDIFTNVPPGTVDIYGIRKHGTSLRYQPPGCPGKINQPSIYIDTMFTSFFQLMVELISCVLDNTPMSQSRYGDWIYKWGTRVKMDSTSVAPNIECLLNADEEDVPELENSGLWHKGRMFGTITGVPVHWLSCIPVMSYLLYIPRLWGVFYSAPRILPSLSRLSKRSFGMSPVIREIIGGTSGYSHTNYSSRLWRNLTKKLMLPLWFTPCGKECFWTFTYLLVRCAAGKVYSSNGSIDDTAEKLNTIDSRGGFKSWSGWYRAETGAPDWYQKMRKELYAMGPSAMVDFGRVAEYI